ncbi:hypothetical protein AC230_10485 [Streptomyces caatingaensis]|uniref:WXG100 family type VII secretion target n=2 Tax=Streptomyces caatingaensis TaxID=1678637 RepID=A0A0K9XHY3_9ACTN|nr:hypothetical protein [Streptomyces caatingaensis]KNB53014.1 hypothetical protein AC230_10485 [Streptomyces caatingaensis]
MGGSGSDKVLDIKTADIKAVAPVFRRQGKKLSDALTTLVNTLDGLGKPWGDDKPGKQFAAKYGPNQKEIERATGILVLGLVSIHQAMVEMADGHVANDKAIAGIFTKDAR